MEGGGVRLPLASVLNPDPNVDPMFLLLSDFCHDVVRENQSLQQLSGHCFNKLLILHDDKSY